MGIELRCTLPRGEVHHKSQATPCTTSSRTLAIISILVSITCATSRVETLEYKHANGLQQLRPQLHLILRSNPGFFKTTILQEACKKYGVTPFSNVTYPAMIGTIDPLTRKVVPGLVWQTRNKPLFLDEFKTGERGDAAAIDVLLGVMEAGYYKRKIGMLSEDCHEKDGSLFYKVKSGEIEVKTRFSSIIATMKQWDKITSDKYEALTQRCIPVRYALDNATVDAVLVGGAPVYSHHEYKPTQQVTIGRRDALKIREFVANVRETNQGFQSVYTRAFGDLCRIYAVTGTFDPELFRLVCLLKARFPLDEALRLASDQGKIS